ncbi:HAD-IA family hydrolase [Halorubrum aethiopicum]|uniref:HAD-IA family hydrolase n=1 Tax=Halorubrum aethiopicum TaxID=1758255 RepID=UPI0008343A48|nr:HAD-IA family hydrolase [Halorubrum aethiopicum]
MTFEPDRVDTVLVDSYSTLVDELSTRRALEKHTDNPEAVARIWDLRGSLYGITSALLDDFKPTRDRYRVSLEYALQTAGVEVSAAEREAILDTVDDLDVYDDVREGLERLIDDGYEIYMLSNGDPEMLDELVVHADVDDLLSDTISAADAGVCKPGRELYRHAAHRAGTAVSRIVHVTASWYDVQGALYTGMQGVWMNRAGTEWEEILRDPHLEIETFHELADELGA